MTKTTKALLTSAAFAGLFAGTGAAVKASALRRSEADSKRLTLAIAQSAPVYLK
jgi:hypothetical protein